MKEAHGPAAIDDFFDYVRALEGRVARLEKATFDGFEADFARPEPGRATDADIRAAYRIVLDREPDPHGLRFYRSQVSAMKLRPRDLAFVLAGSPEAAKMRAQRLQVVDVEGVKVAVDATEREFGRTIARDATWESHIIKTIRRCLQPGQVFVDIGANVGVMSFQAAAAVGPSGRVIAFEPNPENIQRFLHGVMLNGFDQVQLWPLAASDGQAMFALRGGSNSALEAAALGETLLQTVAADILLADEPAVHLIKIDIEGHEPRALSGLARTIARCKPILLCEFNPRCLKGAGGGQPAAFAEQVFSLARSVEIIEHSADRHLVQTPQDLLKIWHERNAEHVAKRDLAPGLLHFDLLICPA